MGIEQMGSSFDHEAFRQFRDQKSGDFNPETKVVYEADQASYDKGLAYRQQVEAFDKVGSSNEAERRIVDLIDRLNNVSLQSQYSENEAQQLLLKNKIAIMKQLIEQSLEYAVEYVDSIRRMSKVKLGRSEMNREDYLDEMRESDTERRAKHNALIDSLKIANRFLQNNFGNLTEERRQKFVKDELRAGRQILEVERQDFGNNGLVSEKVDLNNRDQVKDWAIVVVDSLEQIKKEL